MSNSNILLIFSNHRVAEKLWHIIPELSQLADVDLFLIGLCSTKTKWVGDVDERMLQINKYSKHIRNIIIGPGVSYHGDVIKQDLSSFLDITRYKLVLYDDNRSMHEYNLPQLYQKFKSHNILVIGNSHGNEEFTNNKYAFDISIDKVFTFGYKEKYILTNNFDYRDSDILEGGIPQNDELGKYKNNPKHILVITNFLGNRNSIFPINFDKNFVIKSGLLELSKVTNLPIVVKHKARLDKIDYINDVAYIKNLLDCDVVTNCEDINQLIADSAYVVSALSTLAFKPIQLGIPTVVINGTGQIGNYYDYNGLVNLDYEQIYNSLNQQKEFGKQNNFIMFTIQGGLDFTSTKFYIDAIKKEYENNLQNK